MSGDKSTPYRFLYRLVSWIVKSSLKLLFGLKAKGLKNIPKDGAFIFASNHRSLIDPPIIGSLCPREVYFAAKKELFEIAIIGNIIRYFNSVPVRRTGYDRGMLKLLGEALDGGYGITIFPEGTRSRDGKLGRPKPGVGILSKIHNAVVVPVYISGSADLLKQLFRRKLEVQFGNILTFDAVDFSDAKDEKEIYRKISEDVLRSIAELGGVTAPV